MRGWNRRRRVSALAVVERLKAAGSMPGSNPQPSDLELLWIGGEGGMEEDLVKRAGLHSKTIPAAGLHGVGLRALPRI